MTDPDSLLGTQLNEFVLDEYIGRGAMALVYKATDTRMDRSIALKLVSKTMDLAPAMAEARKRLKDEAKVAGRLSHPNIVTVHGWGETREFLYICMEYVPGRTMADILREKKVLKPDDAVFLFEQILKALAAAAEEKIVHRDIKPSNIMVMKDNRVKVMDFGIAKMPNMHQTVDGMVVGTVYYMSTEQILGQPVDSRSDLYSVGVVLYEALTGKRPFEGENIGTVTYKITSTEPIPLRELNVSIPEPLERICLKALAKNPGLRYQTPTEMLAALRAGHSAAMPVEKVDMDETVILVPGSAGTLGGAAVYDSSAPGTPGSVPGTWPGRGSSGVIVKPRDSKWPLKKVLIASTAALITISGGAVAVRQFMNIPKQPSGALQQPQPSGISVEEQINLARTLVTVDPSRARKLLEDAIVREPNHAEAFLELAKLFERNGDFQAATGQYKNALRLNGKDAGAWFSLGKIYLAAGDFDHALESFESCRALSPSNKDEVLTSMGVAYSRKGDPGRAVDFFKEAVDLNSENQTTRKSLKDSITALVSQAREQLHKNPGNAEKMLEKALVITPDNYDASFALAGLLEGKKDYRAAIEQYRNGLRVNSKDAGAWFRMGSIYLTIGDFDHALESFESCRALSPSNKGDVLACMGVAYMGKNDPGRAADLFKEALDLSPGNETALKSLKDSVAALVSQAKEQLQKNPANAEKMLRKTLAIAPDNYDASLALAGLLEGKKDYRAAIEQYRNALRLNGKDAAAWFRMGTVYFQVGDFDHALESFESCKALSPSNKEEVLLNLGAVYANKNDPGHAADLFKEAAELNSGNEIARKSLKDSIASLASQAKEQLQKNPANAEKMLQKLLVLDPDNRDASVALAVLREGEKDYQPAIEQYRKVLKVNSKDAETWFNLGSIYLTIGDYDHALESFESCRALSPSNKGDVLASMGVAYTGKNDPGRAADLFKEALDVNPGNETARKSLKDSIATLVSQANEQSRKDPVNAEKMLKRALAIAPDNYDASFALAGLLEGKKDYQAAIEQYRHALRLKGKDVEAWFRLGTIYLIIKDFDHALESFESCRALSPSSKDDVLASMGLAYTGKNDPGRAAGLFKEALDLNPGNEIARKSLTDSIAALASQAKEQLQKNPANAEKMLEKLLVLDPDNRDASVALAGLREGKKDYQPAIEQYMKVLKVNSKDAETWFNLGTVYLTIGDYGHALESFASCSGLSPTNKDEVLTSMGVAYTGKNDHGRAADLFKEALGLNSKNEKARRLLADNRQDGGGGKREVADRTAECPGYVKEGHGVDPRPFRGHLPNGQAAHLSGGLQCSRSAVSKGAQPEQKIPGHLLQSWIYLPGPGEY